MLGSADARAMHAAHPPIDLHADTLMWSRWLGYDLHKRHTPPLPKAALGGHVDVPRMRDGGMAAQFFGLGFRREQTVEGGDAGLRGELQGGADQQCAILPGLCQQARP